MRDAKKYNNYAGQTLDNLPYYGAAIKAIECKTGKEYLTDKELTPKERFDRGVEVAEGIGKDLFGCDIPKKVGMVNKAFGELLDIVSEKEKERKADRPKNKQKSKSKSRRRSRDRSRDKSKSKKGRSRKSRKNKK